MDIPRQTRMEMDALSKEVFGSASKWQTILKRGTTRFLTKKVQQVIPGKDGEEPTTKETEVLVLTQSGGKQSIVKRYTVEEIRDLMLNFKKQMDDFKAKSAAEEALKNTLDNVKDAAQGSAVI